jgi:hypothetical protein
MKKAVFIGIICFGFAQLASAQNDNLNNNRNVVVVKERRGVTLSGGLQLAVPKGEFAENYNGRPFGINANLSIPMLHLPFEIGGGFIWNGLGKADQEIDIVDKVNQNIQKGDLNVNGNAYTYQLHGRFRPFNGRFRPYGELFAGVRTFSIRSSLDVRDVNQSSGELLERSFTFLAGYAIGAKYEMVPGIFLEARFTSQAGSNATYVDPESIVIDPNGNFSYGTLNSTTDQWALSLGIAFSL